MTAKQKQFYVNSKVLQHLNRAEEIIKKRSTIVGLTKNDVFKYAAMNVEIAKMIQKEEHTQEFKELAKIL